MKRGEEGERRERSSVQWVKVDECDIYIHSMSLGVMNTRVRDREAWAWVHQERVRNLDSTVRRTFLDTQIGSL